MKMLQKAEIRRAAARYGLLLLGTAILSFGLYNVHSQSQITEGGVFGLQLLFQHWFHISPSITGPVMDIACYLAAWKLLGGGFIKNAVIASLGYSFFYSLHERTGHLLPYMGDKPLLAAALGGLFVGVGVGLIVRSGGASGGDDALALILNKLTKVKLEKCYLATDVVVLMLSLSYISPMNIACSLVTVSISSFLIGKLYGDREEEETPEQKKRKAAVGMAGAVPEK